VAARAAMFQQQAAAQPAKPTPAAKPKPAVAAKPTPAEVMYIFFRTDSDDDASCEAPIHQNLQLNTFHFTSIKPPIHHNMAMDFPLFVYCTRVIPSLPRPRVVAACKLHTKTNNSKKWFSPTTTL
jgi:hypothetical protein